ncbi:putative transporter [Thelohanellus kitauei]|uniref:Putative transporter n=1 Tax=Thelohanellus kitauei TaxID=669202 RepID=A0A0C2N424_THEKT|nr:putative transporter [Thelohanellus kitauei]
MTGRFQKFNKFRYIVCLTAWLALLALYSHRINLSIGIIGMTKEKVSNKTEDTTCPIRYNKTDSVVESETEKFEWSESMQNYVLLAYNVGYMVGHVPGAFLSIRFGYRKVMVFCLGASTFLTLVSVFVAPYQWIFFGIRSIIGLVNGPLYPIVHETIAGHSPPSERTFLTLFTHTGNLISLVLILPIGGLFIDNFVNGWKYIFYLSGGLGILATIMWFIFVYSEPEENPWMSIKEQNYITTQIYPKGKPPKKTMSNVPFCKIFTSPHLYIFTIVHFGKLFVLYMNLFGIVKYLYKYFSLSPVMAGNLAVIPFIADFLFQTVYPRVVNVMKNSGMKITNIRKLNTFLGALGCSSFLIASGFIPCTNLVGGIVLQTLSLMFLAPFQAGYFTAIIEHAPQYAGVTFSFINIGGTFSGVAQRFLVAQLSEQISDMRVAYKYSFIITGIVSFALSMVYVMFGTADLQPWAQTGTKSTEMTQTPERKTTIDENTTEIEV